MKSEKGMVGGGGRALAQCGTFEVAVTKSKKIACLAKNKLDPNRKTQF